MIRRFHGRTQIPEGSRRASFPYFHLRKSAKSADNLSSIRLEFVQIVSMKTLQFLLVGFLTSLVLTVGAVAGSTQEQLTAAQIAYGKGDSESAKKLFQEVLKVDPKNQVAIGFLRKIAVEDAKKPQVTTLQKQLEKLIVPKVEFRDATLGSALDFLKQTAAKNSDGKVVVSFVAQLTEEKKLEPVTLSLANIPYSEVLRYLGEVAKVDFTYDKYAIVVKPRSSVATADAAPVPAAQ